MDSVFDPPYVSLSELDISKTMNVADKKQILPGIVTVPAMSQWSRVQHNQLVLDQMQNNYPPHFPMEVRYFLCQWIEEQPWHLISESNIQHSQVAVKLLTEMLELLQQKASELVEEKFFLIKFKLEESYNKIKSIMETRPLEMIQTIKNCLAKEEILLTQSEEAPQHHQMNDTPQEGDEHRINELIKQEILSLAHRTKCTDEELKQLQHKQESFILQFSDSQQIMAQQHQLSKQQGSPELLQKINQLKAQKDQIDVRLTALAHELLLLRNELSKKYEQTIISLQGLQKEILDNRLISWKRKQQLAGNGSGIANSDLEVIQQWCNDLADLIWQNRQQIKKSTQLQKQLPIKFPEGKEEVLPKLTDQITNLLSSLVTSTFIVEQQPPQVLKKDARFSAAICLLVGGKLDVHMNPPQVKATIISEQQASDLLKPKGDFKAKNCSSGDILNNVGTMEYQSKTGHLGITFRNMQLKKIKRADKRGSESVTEEKFCILFQSDFTVGGNELIFQVWTLSLPVVVTVHGNQECNATATIIWDNAFAEPGRLSFAVPDQVEWSLLAEQLNMKFRHLTGKELSKAHLAYLASKLFRDKDPSTCKISWAQFNKDVLTNRSFTFWEWFYHILKLIKEHLKELWVDDAIVGFVSKNQAQNMLSNQQLGTFLLRFSDSEIGGITIAWTGEKEVLNLAPFTSKDFNIRGLPNRIGDLNDLVNLYPNIPKDQVFRKYYRSNVEKLTSEGYVCPELKTTIPAEFKSSPDVEIKQPFSQSSCYDSNLNSVQSMEEYPCIVVGDVPEEFIEFDFDYMPGDIDQINEITVQQLITTDQCSG